MGTSLFGRFRRARGRGQHLFFDTNPLDQQHSESGHCSNSGHHGAGNYRDTQEFADNADIVRVPQPPIGAPPNQRRIGDNDDAEGPERAEAEDRPPLQRLRRSQNRHAGADRRGRRRGSPPPSPPSPPAKPATPAPIAEGGGGSRRKPSAIIAAKAPGYAIRISR